MNVMTLKQSALAFAALILMGVNPNLHADSAQESISRSMMRWRDLPRK